MNKLRGFALIERDAAVQMVEAVTRSTSEDVSFMVDKFRTGHSEFWVYLPCRILFLHILPSGETPGPEPKAVPFEVDLSRTGTFFEMNLATMSLPGQPLTLDEMISFVSKHTIH